MGSEEPIEQRNCDERPFCISIPSLFDATREVRREKSKGSAGIGLHRLFFAVQKWRLRRSGQRRERVPGLQRGADDGGWVGLVPDLAFERIQGEIEELNAGDGFHGFVIGERPDDGLRGRDFDDVWAGSELTMTLPVGQDGVAVG